MFPSLAHEKSSSSTESDIETMTLREKELANSIDDYFRENMINERNRRMASRVINLLVQHPRTPFFFAFGAAHFVGEHTVLDFVESAGFTIKQIGHNETLPEYVKIRLIPKFSHFDEFFVADYSRCKCHLMDATPFKVPLMTCQTRKKLALTFSFCNITNN